MKEIWRPVVGYEGLYEVSNHGRVKSLNYNKRKGEIRILKEKLAGRGYHSVCLVKGNEKKYKYIHKLVAEAFIPNPNNYQQVNHKDEDKTNNFVYVNIDGTIDIEKSNLEWCTAKYNSNYGTRNKRCNEAKRKKVRCVETNIIYLSLKEASMHTKCNKSNISGCCLNKYGCRTAGGYHWEYID